ncbi:very short patch repair endonuclease [Hymenobacter sp. AT01-02]|uniref:very short patch repair endonuclease n=1 Tax=Hymenobacter sp. AT01-02 TaxID=1571877 RepID=UPI0005F159F8|nr:very short patch repair endonuclease [Hymenobacter sp. AT01-02]
MADVHSTATRSYNMSQIKGKDTKPELVVRQYLHGQGLRFRLHQKELPGKPDIVLPRYRTAVFVHGCFWHGHEGCRYFVTPKTRTDFWMNKIGRNVANDLKQQAELATLGWKVVTIWECELKTHRRQETLAALVDNITGPPDSAALAT